MGTGIFRQSHNATVVPGDFDVADSTVELTQAEMDSAVLPLPTEADYMTALERLYDATAQERRYDNRLTCALRAGYPGPFQADGTAFGVWMDECNAMAYQLMLDVLAGQAPQPTIPELLAMLPPLVWPE